MTKAKMFSLLWVSAAFTLFGSGCCLNQGPCAKSKGEVASISYGPYPGGSGTGAVQCVYSIPADSTHLTTWKMKKCGATKWGPARNVGYPPVVVSSQSSYADYDLWFTPPGSASFDGNPVLVRVFRDKLAIVAIHYKR